MESMEEVEQELVSPKHPDGREEDENGEGFVSSDCDMSDYDSLDGYYREEEEEEVMVMPPKYTGGEEEKAQSSAEGFFTDNEKEWSDQENHGGALHHNNYQEHINNETHVSFSEEEVKAMPPGKEEAKIDGGTDHQQGGDVIPEQEGSFDSDHREEWSGNSSPGRYYDQEQKYDFFERVYHCYPLSFLEKSAMETGNKIIMPPEALMDLMETRITMPMMFEIQNMSSNRISHCGVLEFTGMDTEAIYVPEWMMKNLQLGEGDSVRLRSTSLVKGAKIKLQPHTMDFLEIKNPKAVLEHNLQNFCCLTAGDTIMITHGTKSFYINVVETEPEHAICIIDTDCEVDFAPPLNYKVPEKRAMKKVQECSTHGMEEMEEPKFIPFTGKSNRLGGGAWKQEEWNQHPKFEGLDEEPSTMSPEELEKLPDPEQGEFSPFMGSSRILGGTSAYACSVGNRQQTASANRQQTATAGGRSMAATPNFKPFTGLSRRTREPEPSMSDGQ
ncbi:hypothetical protein SLA2020_021560 [Shorea laevis]